MNNSVCSKQSLIKKELRFIDCHDLEVISDIHMAAFPTSSWSRLGKTIVEKYYLWQLNDVHPLVSAKCCFIENKGVGFCFSGIFRGSTSGFLSTYRNLLIQKTLMKPWLIIYPEFRKGLLKTNKLLKHFPKTKNIKKDENVKQDKNPSYGILSIAVLPEFQGYGIGKVLLNDAELIAQKNNFGKMHLTVNVKNLNAINFYERSGWEKVLVNNLWSGAMEKKLVK